jgi:hypothetical protein
LQLLISAFTLSSIAGDDDNPPSEELHPSIFLRTLNKNDNCKQAYYSSVATHGCDDVYKKENYIFYTVAILQLLTIGGLGTYLAVRHTKKSLNHPDSA